MCWIGKFQLKKAKRDIPIVKIMLIRNKQLFSFYQHYPYVLNKKIESEIFEELSTLFSRVSVVTKALHSYDKSIKIINGVPYKSAFSIQYNNLMISLFLPPWEVVKVNGIIPKGAEYCKNKKGEYISNELILQEIIKI